MFASLKSKIKEETGSDISKLTSSWRSGAFLGRITLRDDSVSCKMFAFDFVDTGKVDIKNVFFLYDYRQEKLFCSTFYS